MWSVKVFEEATFKEHLQRSCGAKNKGGAFQCEAVAQGKAQTETSLVDSWSLAWLEHSGHEMVLESEVRQSWIRLGGDWSALREGV